MPNNPLIGTWKLIKAIAIHADGKIDSEVYGANPNGYITYTSDGQMMVMFSRSDRLLFDKDIQSPLSGEMNALPIEDLARSFTSFNAYAGTYILNGNTVIHQIAIASIPNRVGKTLIRTFAIDGNRIVLKTPETIVDGTAKVFELTWERV
jgi:Lipocalin-like domain